MEQKKRHVVSYEKMSEELAAAFNEKYPKGFNDYLPDLMKYTKPDGTPFYAVTVETPDSINLVKINIKIDDAEDIERWLDEEESSNDPAGDSPSGSDSDEGTLPDDNISQYGGDDDSAE